MSDATITHLPGSGVERTTPRDCGVARVIDLRPRPLGRVIDPAPSPRAASGARTTRPSPTEPGRLARALMALADDGARS